MSEDKNDVPEIEKEEDESTDTSNSEENFSKTENTLKTDVGITKSKALTTVPHKDFLCFSPTSLGDSGLGLTSLCAAFLLLIHWLTPRIRRLDILDNGIINSIGGGLALGYVFLHALPELMHQVPYLSALNASAFLKSNKNLIFTVFLWVTLGFCTAYGLEKIAFERTKRGHESNGFVYSLHLGFLTYLSFSIVLMMPVLGQTSGSLVILFSIIMAFHFLLEDHAMTYHFPLRYAHVSRYLPTVAVFLGWLIGNFALREHASFFLTFMHAFLAGALVMSVVKTEFSWLEGRSNFPTFLLSLGIKAVIVFVWLLLDNIG